MKLEQKSKILIVNNSITIFNTIKDLLERFNCDISLFYAKTGSDAITKINTEPGINLIITGLKLDDYTGITIANHIRKFRSIPIIIFTDYERNFDSYIDNDILYWKRNGYKEHPQEFIKALTLKLKNSFSNQFIGNFSF